jgi:hypothetical protein
VADVSVAWMQPAGSGETMATEATQHEYAAQLELEAASVHDGFEAGRELDAALVHAALALASAVRDTGQEIAAAIRSAHD